VKINKVIIATKNKGKIKEFENFFNRYKIEVKSLLDINEAIDIEETGTTFEENALIKARFLSDLLQETVLADDSGLEVDALDNEPGIYSARYSGIHGDDRANNEKLLKNLQSVPMKERTARFVCALAVVSPNQVEKVVRGTCEGLIIDELRGLEGFGYDPLFYIPSLDKTFGELTKEQKQGISHRGNALMKLERLLFSGDVNE
jgi:XTP/dITP diphosphohydrolase